MNNKLSKEQAQWLIREIRNKQEGQIIACMNASDASSVLNQVMQNIETSINQCTEKEFPSMGLKFVNPNFIGNQKIAINNTFDHSIYLAIESSNCYFTYEKFKEFTSGCQAICEWIEEQE